MRPILRAAIAVHFRRAVVVGRERFPKHGAALIAANHPSTWSDVLLLEGLLGRRLHFLAESGQFHPWPRAALIRAFGTLPVYLHESERLSSERNEKTFRLCRELLDRGEVVAIFPEGVSRTDRSLMPLKRGAARLALSYAQGEGAGPSFALVPIALRYSDRTAFRSDVAVIVGKPIARSELRTGRGAEGAAPDGAHDPAVDHLTERLADTLHALAAMPDDPDDAPILAVLEAIAAARNGSLSVDAERVLKRPVDLLRRTDPAGHAELRRLAHRHERARRTLQVSDRALITLSSSGSASRSLRYRAGLAMMALPFLAGVLIHALPAYLAHLASRRASYGPSEVAFARIVSGTVFLLLTYAAFAWLGTALGARPVTVALVLALFALLGIAALGCGDRLRPEWERLRLASIARRHPKLVTRARESGAALARCVGGILRASETER